MQPADQIGTPRLSSKVGWSLDVAGGPQRQGGVEKSSQIRHGSRLPGIQEGVEEADDGGHWGSLRGRSGWLLGGSHSQLVASATSKTCKKYQQSE